VGGSGTAPGGDDKNKYSISFAAKEQHLKNKRKKLTQRPNRWEIAAAGRRLKSEREFYPPHSFGLIISFYIVFGIFIPHTASTVDPVRSDSREPSRKISGDARQCLLITEGNNRYEYTTEAA